MLKKKKPKVTIFHCTLIYSGGGERIVFGQMDELEKRGYEVECFAPILDKKRCFPDIIDNYKVRSLLPQLPEFFPFRHAILLLLTSILIPLLAFRFRDTDVFIGENQPGIWLAFVASKILRKPYIAYTCHPNKMLYPRALTRSQIWKNQPDFYALSLLFEPVKPLFAALDRLSFRGGKGPILTNGFFIGKEVGQTYDVAWKGCPCGVSISVAGPPSDPDKAFEGKIRIGKGIEIAKPYILFVGRHEVWKRINWAIKAMKDISRKVPEAKFVIPGPIVATTNDLIDLAWELGIPERVLFTGEVNQKDLAKLFREAAVFLFPSDREDLGIVMIEAMGSGVPVVAWNSAGPIDIVVDGQTGFLAEPLDLGEMVDKVVKLLRDRKLRLKMAQASWKRAQKEFSWERHVDILEKAILDANIDNPIRI